MRSTIVYRRGIDSAGLLRRIKVERDGSVISALKQGEEHREQVEAGTYAVKARMDWGSSELLTFELPPHSCAVVEVALPLSGIKRLLWNTSQMLSIRVSVSDG